jgi:transcriptional regulator with XRE-family HTH domain
MKDRIRQLMESQHLSQQEFADKLEISPASLSSIFNERTRPTLNHVDAIKRSFPNINLSWLLYGDGEMFSSGQQNASVNDAAQAGSPTQTQLPGNDLMLDFSSPAPTPPVGRTAQMPQAAPSRTDVGHDLQFQKIVDIKQRKITEIRIFYDDQTWETFLPKK